MTGVDILMSMAYAVQILRSAQEYLKQLKLSESGTVRSDFEAMGSGDFDSVLHETIA